MITREPPVPHCRPLCAGALEARRVTGKGGLLQIELPDGTTARLRRIGKGGLVRTQEKACSTKATASHDLGASGSGLFEFRPCPLTVVVHHHRERWVSGAAVLRLEVVEADNHADILPASSRNDNRRPAKPF